MPIDPTLLRERLKALDARLSAEDAAAISPRLQERRLAPGETLLAEGRVPDAAWIAWEGQLAVRARVRGEEKELATLGPGDLVGEVSFLDGGPATASVVALGEASVVGLRRDAFEEIERSHPDAAMQLHHAASRTLAKRLRMATDRLEDLRSGGEKGGAQGPGLFEAFRHLFGLGLS